MLGSLRCAAIAGIFALAACNGGTGAVEVNGGASRSSPDVPTDEVAAVATSERALGIALYGLLARGSGNVLLSPHSLAESLTMLYAGAENETRSAMRTTLQLTLPDDKIANAMNALDLRLEGSGLTMANAVWAPQSDTFLESYLKTIALDYGTGVELLDFEHAPAAATQTIDAAIFQKTNGKIDNLVGALTSNTRLVLTSAITFDAPWLTAFNTSQTTNGPFTREDGVVVSTPMMKSTLRCGVYTGDDLLAVSLPYANGELSMLIIEPDDLASFEAGFTETVFDGIVAGLTQSTTELWMPKWSFTSTSDLMAPLSTLGAAVIFDGSSADFSGMDGQRDLYVSDLAHASYIAVSESGVDASIAQITGTPTNGDAPGPGAVLINRPFVFAVRDPITGALLFIGRVVDPTATQ